MPNLYERLSELKQQIEDLKNGIKESSTFDKLSFQEMNHSMSVISHLISDLEVMIKATFHETQYAYPKHFDDIQCKLDKIIQYIGKHHALLNSRVSAVFTSINEIQKELENVKTTNESNQNRIFQILNDLIKNDISIKKEKLNLKKIGLQGILKIILTLLGSGGIIYLIIQTLIK